MSKGYVCRQCTSGWEPGTPKTFSKTCVGCQEKLEAGMRTGKEPAPTNSPSERRRQRKDYQAQIDRQRRVTAAKQANRRTFPEWREC